MDLVVAVQQGAFKCAIKQVIRVEQCIGYHVVLEHIRVLESETVPLWFTKFIVAGCVDWQLSG